VLEVPSFLAYPLAPSIAAKPTSGILPTASYYPTWKLASKELYTVLNSLWELLEPETEKIIGNVAMLPIVYGSQQLPYQDFGEEEAFFIPNLPECLIPPKKLGSKDRIDCHLCGEKMMLNKMRNHVGRHILHSLHEIEDPKICTTLVGVNPCGFCGKEGCFTQLKLHKNGSASINSNCIYHYSGMQYKRAAQFSNP
jgi:hypothetical protein